MVQVPEGAHALHADRVEHTGQAGRVSVLGGGLHEHGHVVDARDAAQLLEQPHDVLVIDPAHGAHVAGEQHAHVRRTHVARELDVVGHLAYVVAVAAVVCQLAVGREARDLEAEALQLLVGVQAAARAERRRVGREGPALDAADCDAVKAEVLGHGVDVGPRIRGATEGGKRELHMLFSDLGATQ